MYKFGDMLFYIETSSMDYGLYLMWFSVASHEAYIVTFGVLQPCYVLDTKTEGIMVYF